jgi:hypothetical protein
MPGQRIYFVNSVSLIQQIQRQPKVIAFEPVAAQAAATAMGVSPAGNAVIGANNMREADSYISAFGPFIAPALSPGAGLDSITSVAVQSIYDSLAELNKSQMKVDLFSWIRRKTFMALTEAIYGPANPFRNPALENAY